MRLNSSPKLNSLNGAELEHGHQKHVMATTPPYASSFGGLRPKQGALTRPWGWAASTDRFHPHVQLPTQSSHMPSSTQTPGSSSSCDWLQNSGSVPQKSPCSMPATSTISPTVGRFLLSRAKAGNCASFRAHRDLQPNYGPSTPEAGYSPEMLTAISPLVGLARWPRKRSKANGRCTPYGTASRPPPTTARETPAGTSLPSNMHSDTSPSPLPSDTPRQLASSPA